MARPPSSQPTELEMQILRVLWDAGECTVRRIHESLVGIRGDAYGYASTVKMLHVMLGKGLVSDDDSVRPKTYRAMVSEKRTQRSMLKDLVHRVYDGSSAAVILHALSDHSITQEELDQIRQMLKKREAGS